MRSEGFDGRSFGDFELIEELGRGGMGVVFKARQKSLGRIVALKTLRVGEDADNDLAQRLRAEASAAASLHHPHIVAIHEVGAHEGQPYFAMQFIEGQNLARVNAACEMRDAAWIRRAARWVRTVAAAIHHAHEHGILHRDLKPSNILIDPLDEPRITDFGLAKRLSHESDLTLSGQVLGSPNYMPPEQAMAQRGKVGRRSDVYALGAILYHLLTGRPPCVGQTLAETLQEVLTREPIAPRLLNPAVPRDLETLCLKCLEKEPDRRYATADLLAAELERFLRDEPIHARPVGRVEKAWRWCRRKPAFAASLAALLMAVVGGVTGIAWQWRRAESESERAHSEAYAARKNLYAADMNLASQALEAGNLGRAVELLEKNRPTPVRPPGPDPRGWEWRYLWSQTRSDELFTLGTNDHVVEGMVFDTNTKRLLTSDAKGVIKLWDFPSRRVVGELRHPGSEVRVAISPDGQRLISGGYGGNVCIWDLRSGQTVAVMTNRLLIQSVAFSPNGLLVAARESNRIAVWDALTGVQVLLREEPMQYYGVAPCGIAFAPSGQLLAYGKFDGSVGLLDLGTQAEVATLPGNGHNVTVLAFSPDGRLMAAATDCSSVYVWNLNDRRKLAVLGKFAQQLPVPVYGLTFSPDGSRLMLGQSNHQLVLYDTSTWSELASFKGHRGEVLDIAFLRDGRHLVSSAKDATLKVWDVAQRPPVHSLAETAVHSYELTLDGDILKRERLSEIPSVRRLSLLKPGALTGTERFLGVFTNLAGRSFPNASGPIALRFSDGGIQLWAPASGKRTSELFSGDSLGMDLAPDGRTLLLARTNRLTGERLPIEVWDMSLTNRTGILAAGTNMVDSVAFTPDGRRVILGYGLGAQIGTAEVWDLATQKRLATLGSSKGDRVSAILSRDGKTAYTCDMNSTASIWDVETGRELARMAGEVSAYFSLALSPDESRLAVGGTEILIWDITARPPQHLLTLRNKHWLGQLAFTPDGNTLVALSGSGVRVWHAMPLSETDGGRETK